MATVEWSIVTRKRRKYKVQTMSAEAPPPARRSLSVPATMDRGLPASKFPPVLVMYHPSMVTLAKSLVERVNEENQLTDDGNVNYL